MYDVDIFKNYNVILNKTNKKYILIYITIIMMLIIIFIYISLNYKYEKKYYTTGQVIIYDNKYYIKTYIEEDKINIIYTNLIFDNDNTKYKIKSLGDEYFIFNNKKYYEVNLLFDLDYKYLINNNILELYFIEEKTTLFKSFINKIKKGMNK